jgi:NAD(P)H-flavin reductase
MLKSQITLLHKEIVAPQTFLLTFYSENSIDFLPGQFANFEIETKIYRSYSFVNYSPKLPTFLQNQLESLQQKFPQINFDKQSNSEENSESLTNSQEEEIEKNKEKASYWTFLVSSKSGGIASKLFEKIELSYELPFLAPIGRFGVLDTENEKVFVCTGTGLAPFIPMIKKAMTKAKCTLFFGTSWDAGDYGRTLCENFGLFENPNFVMYSGMFPIQTPNETEFVQNGTVTELLPKYVNEFETKEFYLCGNPFMVLDVEKLLVQNGAKVIIKENFGTIKKD